MTSPQASETNPLLFRAGQPEDQPQIAEMIRDIWEGNDYLAKVWNRWAQTPNSLLRVALLGDEIVATGRVVEQVPGGWWLEGVRVHPAYQGRGFASQLHHHLVELAFEQPGIKCLGMTTTADTQAMAHLAERTEMALRAEYRYVRGSALPETPGGVLSHTPTNQAALLADLQQGAWLTASSGYAMNAWVARPLDADWLGEIVATGGVWRRGGAVALAGRGSYGTEHWLYLLEGGSEQDREMIVRHLRYLAYQESPEALLRCFVPQGAAALLPPLLDAGMQDPEGKPFYLHHFVREQPVTDER
ncbi:MAG: GNAT family N-acetyltransferase [Ardenticatenales bacterium]|nr:GNAT family N-acetyltransferase [Ardenticatenales bacterium]